MSTSSRRSNFFGFYSMTTADLEKLVTLNKVGVLNMSILCSTWGQCSTWKNSTWLDYVQLDDSAQHSPTQHGRSVQHAQTTFNMVDVLNMRTFNTFYSVQHGLAQHSSHSTWRQCSTCISYAQHDVGQHVILLNMAQQCSTWLKSAQHGVKCWT